MDAKYNNLGKIPKKYWVFLLKASKKNPTLPSAVVSGYK
jgi:hypothetical protein